MRRSLSASGDRGVDEGHVLPARLGQAGLHEPLRLALDRLSAGTPPLDDETWHVVKETPKVTGFVGGAKNRPAPISQKEVEDIVGQTSEE